MATTPGFCFFFVEIPVSSEAAVVPSSHRGRMPPSKGKTSGRYNINAASEAVEDKAVIKSGEVECSIHPVGHDRLTFVLKVCV